MITWMKRASQSLIALLAIFSAIALQGQGAGGHVGGTLSDGVLNINLNIANSFTENFFGGVVKACDPLVVVVKDQDFELSKKAVKNFELTELAYIPSGDANVREATLRGSSGFGGEYIAISSVPGLQNTVVLGKSTSLTIQPSSLRCN